MTESGEIEASVPPELIRRLNDEPGKVSVAQLRKIPADRWVSALDGASMHARAKQRLAQACADFPEFVSVCRRLLLQVSFGNALAREIIAKPNWDNLQKILDDAGVRGAETKEAFARHLGPLLMNKRLIFWTLKLVFGNPRNTLSALIAMFADGEAQVRLEAVKALRTFDNSQTEADLVYALDDTSKDVRAEALRILKERLPEEHLASITARAVEEAGKLDEILRVARHFLLALPEKVPGLGPVVELLKISAKGTGAFFGTAAKAAAGAAGGVADAAASAKESVSGAFGRLRRQKGQGVGIVRSVCSFPSSTGSFSGLVAHIVVLASVDIATGNVFAGVAEAVGPLIVVLIILDSLFIAYAQAIDEYREEKQRQDLPKYWGYIVAKLSALEKEDVRAICMRSHRISHDRGGTVVPSTQNTWAAVPN